MAKIRLLTRGSSYEQSLLEGIVFWSDSGLDDVSPISEPIANLINLHVSTTVARIVLQIFRGREGERKTVRQREKEWRAEVVVSVPRLQQQGN